MQRSKQIVSLVAIILLSLACAVPGISSPGVDEAPTSTEVIQPATNTATDTPAPTLTPTFTPTLIYPTARFPSETPTITEPAGTASNTPGPTATFTPINVKMSVSRPTNCRTGPGKEYEVVGTLAVGVTVPVIGRDGSSQYWYIPNPYVFTDYCWVWGEYATFIGPQLLLPAIANPSTPIPTGTAAPEINFTAKGLSKFSCNGMHWLNIGITNKSSTELSSIKVVVQDKTKNLIRSVTYDNFPLANGCDSPAVVNSISGDGGTGVLSGPKFDYNFKGNNLIATITVCSEKGLQGVCATETILLSP